MHRKVSRKPNTIFEKHSCVLCFEQLSATVLHLCVFQEANIFAIQHEVCVFLSWGQRKEIEQE